MRRSGWCRWTLHLPVEHYAELADAAVAWPEARAVLELIELRCSSRKPLAYLIGEAWLMGYRFRCDERALVPRSLIAEALRQGALPPFMPALEPHADGAADEARPLRILDLCTGGGSLAIIAASPFDGRRPWWQATFPRPRWSWPRSILPTTGSTSVSSWSTPTCSPASAGSAST